MATAFDGIGMGMLGGEKSYVNRNNPLSSALSGLKDFGIMYGMDKAGVFDYLNKVGEKKQAIMDKYPALSGKKPAGAIAPSPSGDDYASWDTPAPAISGAVNPAPAESSVTNTAAAAEDDGQTLISDDAADNLFVPAAEAPTQKVPVISTPVKDSTIDNVPLNPAQAAPPPQVGFSGVSPNALQPRNPVQDEAAMQAQYAANSNQSQSVGQGGASGNNIGGQVAKAVVTKLITSLTGLA